MGRLALGLILMVVFMPVAAAQPAQQASDPAAVADAWLAAAADWEAQANLITDDVTLQIVPPPPGTTGVWSGKDQVREFLELGKGQNGLEELVGSWQVNGDRVSGTVMVTVNNFRKWNVGAVQRQFEFVVQGGKVKSWAGIMAEFERPRVQAAAQAYAAAHPAPGSPGMPRTGAPLMLLPLLVVGTLLLMVGAALRRRKA